MVGIRPSTAGNTRRVQSSMGRNSDSRQTTTKIKEKQTWPGRTAFGMTTHEKKDWVVVFGGIGKPDPFSGDDHYNDIWILQEPQNKNIKWNQVKSKVFSGRHPSRRSGCSIAYDSSNRLWLFGGIDSTGNVLSDCYFCEIAQCPSGKTFIATWTRFEISTPSVGTPPLHRHAISTYMSESIIITGGLLPTGAANTDVFRIDLISTEITLIDTLPIIVSEDSTTVLHASKMPALVDSHCVIINDWLVLYGGRSVVHRDPAQAPINTSLFVMNMFNNNGSDSDGDNDNAQRQWFLYPFLPDPSASDNDCVTTTWMHTSMLRESSEISKFWLLNNILLFTNSVASSGNLRWVAASNERQVTHGRPTSASRRATEAKQVSVIPPPRTGMCMNELHGVVIVLGGIDCEGLILNDVWLLKLQSQTWIEVYSNSICQSQLNSTLTPHPPCSGDVKTPVSVSPIQTYVNSVVDDSKENRIQTPSPLQLFNNTGNTSLALNWNDSISLGRAHSLWTPGLDTPAEGQQQLLKHGAKEVSVVSVMLKPDPPATFRKTIRKAFDSHFDDKNTQRDVISTVEGHHPIESHITLRNVSAAGNVTTLVNLTTDVDKLSTDVIFYETNKKISVCIRLTVSLSQSAKRRQLSAEQAFLEREHIRKAEAEVLRQRDRDRHILMEEFKVEEASRVADRQQESIAMEEMRQNERERQQAANEFKQLTIQRDEDHKKELERCHQMEILRKKELDSIRQREKEREAVCREEEVRLKKLAIAEEELQAKRTQLERERELMAREREQNSRERQWEKAKDEEWEREKVRMNRKADLLQTKLDSWKERSSEWDAEKILIKKELEETKTRANGAQLQLDYHDGRRETETDTEWSRRRDKQIVEHDLAKKGEFRSGVISLTLSTPAPEQVVYYVLGSKVPVPLSSSAILTIQESVAIVVKVPATLSIEVRSGCYPGDTLCLLGTIETSGSITSQDGVTFYGQREEETAQLGATTDASFDPSGSSTRKLRIVLPGTTISEVAVAVDNILNMLGFIASPTGEVVTTGTRHIGICLSVAGVTLTATRIVEVISSLVYQRPEDAHIVYIEGKGSMPLMPCVRISGPELSGFGTNSPLCALCTSALVSDSCKGVAMLKPMSASKLTPMSGYITVKFIKGWSSDDFIVLASGFEIDNNTYAISHGGQILGYLKSGNLGTTSTPATKLWYNNRAKPPVCDYLVVIMLSENATWATAEKLLRSMCYRNDSSNPTRPRRTLEAAFVCNSVDSLKLCKQQTQRSADNKKKKREFKWEREPPTVQSIQHINVTVINVDEPTEMHVVAANLVYAFSYQNLSSDFIKTFTLPKLQFCKAATVIDEDTDEFGSGSLIIFLDTLGNGECLDLDPTLSPDIEIENTTTQSNGVDVSQAYIRYKGRRIALLAQQPEVISFDFNGFVSCITAVECLLHTLTYFSDPKYVCIPGLRGITIELKVGDMDVLCNRINVSVKLPHLLLPPSIQQLVFEEGSAPLALAVFQVQHDPFPISLIHLSMTVGAEKGDILSLKDYVGSPEVVPWDKEFNGIPSNITSTVLLVSGIYLLQTSVESELFLYVSNPCSCEVIKQILRKVTYTHTTRNPRLLDKIVTVVTTEISCSMIPTKSATAMRIKVLPIDDETELRNISDCVACQQSVADYEGNCLLPNAIVFDPDTESFQGGHISIEADSLAVSFDILSPTLQYQHYHNSLNNSLTDPAIADSYIDNPIPQVRLGAIVRKEEDGSIWLHESFSDYEKWWDSRCSDSILVGWIGAEPFGKRAKYSLSSSFVIVLSSQCDVPRDIAEHILRCITVSFASPGEYAMLIRMNADAVPQNEARHQLKYEVSPPILIGGTRSLPNIVESKQDAHSELQHLFAGATVSHNSFQEISCGGCLEVSLAPVPVGVPNQLCIRLLTVDESTTSTLVITSANELFVSKKYIGKVSDGSKSNLTITFDGNYQKDRDKIDSKSMQMIIKAICFKTEQSIDGVATAVLTLSNHPNQSNTRKPCISSLIYTNNVKVPFSVKNIPVHVSGGFGGSPTFILPQFVLNSQNYSKCVVEVSSLLPHSVEILLNDIPASQCIDIVTEHSSGFRVTFNTSPEKDIIQAIVRGARLASSSHGRYPVEICIKLNIDSTPSDESKNDELISYRRIVWVTVTPPLLSISKCLGRVTACKSGKAYLLFQNPIIDLPSKKKSLRGHTLVLEAAAFDELGSLRRCIGGKSDVSQLPADVFQFSKNIIHNTKSDEVSVSGVAVGKIQKSIGRLILTFDTRKEVVTPSLAEEFIKSILFTPIKTLPEVAIRISIHEGKDTSRMMGGVIVTGTLVDKPGRLIPFSLLPA